ncbi:helix-turn-helix domain-containing protein [Paracoccus aerodenitrificans]|uniref:helix-turn-helix domain-containing protein n=1 Tax=Paracoccus aerodenitrificans TaxID=3017781 RepID=UPI0022F009F9|nr:helix-turn-helix domain-containing protein [Paracoccus aerodenitrificans]WBU65550.1 helix-turn-helix domain-containing protein [Paracoccus aerodenitrificans]
MLEIFKNEKDDTEEKPRERNPRFTQVYPEGWGGLMTMIAENSNAARLYGFIANHMDPNGGVLVVSQKTLAEHLDVAEITIRRASKWLEERNHLVRVRVGTGVYAYALNPAEVWKSFHDMKPYAVFATKTLVSKSDRMNRNIDRRIKLMMKEAEKPDIKMTELTIDDLKQAWEEEVQDR